MKNHHINSNHIKKTKLTLYYIFENLNHIVLRRDHDHADTHHESDNTATNEIKAKQKQFSVPDKKQQIFES